MPSGGHSLGTRTLRGMFWAYGSYVGGRLLVLASTAVLARILTPEDFGLVALALIFSALLETVSTLGVSEALIVGPQNELEERARTAFYFSLMLGCVLAATTAAVSPLVADFFGEPDVAGLLAVLGLNFALRPLGGTHYALAQRALNFQARTGAELVDVIVRGTVGVILALAGLGAWSIVLGYLAGTVAMVVALWILVPWRPARPAGRRHLRGLIRFGGTLSALDVVAAAISNIDYVFIGRVLGPASLGLYTLGFRLPELLIMNLSIVAGNVLYPAFAAVERDKLSRAFEVSLRYTLMISLPATALLAVLAEPFILELFGDQWEGSVEAMQVLTLYALAMTVGIPAGTVYKSIGRADILVKLAVPRLAVLVVTLALLTDEGIVTVAACQAGVAGAFEMIALTLASRRLHVPFRRIAGIAGPLLLATAAMAGPLLAANALLDGWWALTVGAALGGATYVGALWLVRRDWLLELRATAFPGPPVATQIAPTRETDVIA